MEVLNGRKARFTVIRRTASLHEFPLRAPEASHEGVASFGRALRSLLLGLGLLLIAGSALIHSEHWRHTLPPAAAASVADARHALLQLLAPVWRP